MASEPELAGATAQMIRVAAYDDPEPSRTWLARASYRLVGRDLLGSSPSLDERRYMRRMLAQGRVAVRS